MSLLGPFSTCVYYLLFPERQININHIDSLLGRDMREREVWALIIYSPSTFSAGGLNLTAVPLQLSVFLSKVTSLLDSFWACPFRGPILCPSGSSLSLLVFLHPPTSCKESFIKLSRGFPGGPDGKESACNAGDPRLIPGWINGEWNDYSLQCSCPEDSMEREAWWPTVHGSQRVRESDTTEWLTFSLCKLFISYLNLVWYSFPSRLDWYRC